MLFQHGFDFNKLCQHRFKIIFLQKIYHKIKKNNKIILRQKIVSNIHFDLADLVKPKRLT